jgi:hypothetical protein
MERKARLMQGETLEPEPDKLLGKKGPQQFDPLDWNQLRILLGGAAPSRVTAS